MSHHPLIGISLKMYFGHQETINWVTAASEVLSRHYAFTSGRIQWFVAPNFASLSAVMPQLQALGANAHLAAQNVAPELQGAFTGEVSASVLAEIGCQFVEIGHAERIRHFSETNLQIARKVKCTIASGLTPLLCLGETLFESSHESAVEICRQFDAAIIDLDLSSHQTGSDAYSNFVVAYEPIWAIGATQSAPAEHVKHVVEVLRDHVSSAFPQISLRIIYGGSAGPGTLTNIGPTVDGIFLGRFAHRPEALNAIFDEAAAIYL